MYMCMYIYIYIYYYIYHVIYFGRPQHHAGPRARPRSSPPAPSWDPGSGSCPRLSAPAPASTLFVPSYIQASLYIVDVGLFISLWFTVCRPLCSPPMVLPVCITRSVSQRAQPLEHPTALPINKKGARATQPLERILCSEFLRSELGVLFSCRPRCRMPATQRGRLSIKIPAIRTQGLVEKEPY